MKHGMFLLLLLHLGWRCRGAPVQQGNPVQVTPAQPIVPFNGTIQLHCSTTCPGAQVQWKGLDTSLGNVLTHPGLSILTISSATISMAGLKFCNVNCQGKVYQNKLDLLVYSFPDTLRISPQELVPGQSARMVCSMSKVFPIPIFSWYRGDQKLEDLPQMNENEEQIEEELFDVESSWELAGEKVTEGPPFRCQVELRLNAEISLQKVISVELQTTPLRLSSPARRESEAPATLPPDTVKPPTSAPGSTPGCSQTTAPLKSQDPSMKLSPTHVNPLLELPSSTLPSSPSSSTTPSTLPPSTSSSCKPLVQLVQAPRAPGEPLELICQVACSPEYEVNWTRTPVDLEHYEQWKGGAQAKLRVQQAQLVHQGLYQCSLMTNSNQVTNANTLYFSMNLPPDPDMGALITLWTGGFLLGLLLIAFISHCLWKRYQAQG
ncbi:mucosal addressin cell adhesion molecule 1 [Tachyglossus aculeatus]|uniref:mucosal addressin cell adhesion molecule 1 n=1 Tax=Tachyglossus aculeatus TaxID=9261 RepID=UPI0018F38C07|nr:mucosal addressin cell adhesion molecule 1 [Tachyglossus aculeatus]